MDESREHPRNIMSRHSGAWETACHFLVISFQDLEWTDQVAWIVDFNITGLGIETDKPIEQGFIWFKQPVFGQKCGVLAWCRTADARYRAGIEFIPLSRENEEYLLRQIEQLQPGKPFPDPKQVISELR
jgi:hypothetical protein